MKVFKDVYKSTKRSLGIHSKKEKNGDKDFSVRGGKHGAAGGRSSPSGSEQSIDISTHSAASMSYAGASFAADIVLQGSVDYAQGFDPIRVEPRPNIQTNATPTATPRSALAFTARAVNSRVSLPPLDTAAIGREVQRDQVLPEARERVLPVPNLPPVEVAVVDWVYTMQTIAATIGQTGLERRKVGSLCVDLSTQGEESVLYVEMIKVQTFNFETMAIEDHTIGNKTCPAHVLKVIALSINPSSQEKACNAVFNSWQKCISAVENNFSGAIKNVVVSKIGNLVKDNAGESPFVVSDLYYDYTLSLLPNKTEAKILDIQRWFDARLCKEVMNLVKSSFMMQKSAVSTINKQKYSRYVHGTVKIEDPLAEEDDDDDE